MACSSISGRLSLKVAREELNKVIALVPSEIIDGLELPGQEHPLVMERREKSN
jgi:hypothetical protein